MPTRAPESRTKCRPSSDRALRTTDHTVSARCLEVHAEAAGRQGHDAWRERASFGAVVVVDPHAVLFAEGDAVVGPRAQDTPLRTGPGARGRGGAAVSHVEEAKAAVHGHDPRAQHLQVVERAVGNEDGRCDLHPAHLGHLGSLRASRTPRRRRVGRWRVGGLSERSLVTGGRGFRSCRSRTSLGSRSSRGHG